MLAKRLPSINACHSGSGEKMKGGPVWEEQGGLRGTRGSGSIKGTWATCEYVWHISGLPFYHRAGQEQFQTIIWCAILHLQLQRLHYSLHYFLWHISGLPIHTVEIILSSCELERRVHVCTWQGHSVLDRSIDTIVVPPEQSIYYTLWNTERLLWCRYKKMPWLQLQVSLVFS